jgi:hypothetical protein
MAIRLSKFQASEQSPVSPPVAPVEEPVVADFPVAEEEQVEVTALQSEGSSWGDGVLQNISSANESPAEEEVPQEEAEEYLDEGDEYADMFYMEDEYAGDDLNPLERIGSSVSESFAPDDDAVPESPTPVVFDDYDDAPEEEHTPDEVEGDYSDVADNDEPAYSSSTASTSTPYATADPDVSVPADISYSPDGAYILKDETGAYFPWALAFLQTLDEDDALSLDPDDYPWWEAIAEGADETVTPTAQDYPSSAPDAPSEASSKPEQVSLEDDVKDASHGDSRKSVGAFFVKVLDGLAGFLNKGSKIPLLGRLFRKSIPGTPTGRGIAGVMLALLVFLTGSFINNQIVGDRTFDATGSTSVELADGAKVSVAGVARKDGSYSVVLKNDGRTNATHIHGSLHAQGAQAYNPLSWFNKDDLGTCTFSADVVKAGSEVSVPLTCSQDVSGKGSMTFENVTVDSEDV